MIGRTAQDELRVVLGLLRDERGERGRAGAGPEAGRPEGTHRERAGRRDAGGAADVGRRRPALPGARAVHLPGRPGGADQRRQACAGSPGHGRAHRLRQLRPHRGRPTTGEQPRDRRVPAGGRPARARATGSSACASGSPRSAAGWSPSRSPAAAFRSSPRSRSEGQGDDPAFSSSTTRRCCGPRSRR